MPYPQGAVVLAEDPFGNTPHRPFLVLSTDQHPFHEQECIAAVVTTTSRESAIKLANSDFDRGSLPRESYVSPWNPVTIKEYMVEKHIATVVDSVVDRTVTELNTYF